MLIFNSMKIKIILLIFVLIITFKFLAENDSLRTVLAISNVIIDEVLGREDCEIPEDLRHGKIQFDEEIMGAFNFREHTAKFPTFVHLYKKKYAIEEAISNQIVWFQTKNIPQEEIYEVVGCKKKFNFEGTYYLLLKGTTHNSQFLIDNRDFDEFKKKVSNNDYFIFYEAIKFNNHSLLQEMLKKVSWQKVAPKALDILAESGDEKTFDILVAHSGKFPAELFMMKIYNHSNFKILPRALPLIPKEKRANWLEQFFYLIPANQLSIFKEIKKEDIDESRYTSFITFACIADDYKEKLEYLATLGFNFKEKNEDGASALHQFAQFGNSNVFCIDFLLSQGLNINDVDNNGDTPLHRSNSVLKKKLSLYLISKGALTTIKNKKGQVAAKY